MCDGDYVCKDTVLCLHFDVLVRVRSLGAEWVFPPANDSAQVRVRVDKT